VFAVNKSNFKVKSVSKVVLCPYDCLICRYFDSISGVSECCVFSVVVKDYFRCWRLPLWVPPGNQLAVFSDGRLHV
jgi:hypothetical protein